MCRVKVSYKIASDDLLDKLDLKSLETVLQENQWDGHVCCSNSWINKCTNYKVVGKGEHGQPGKNWQQCIDSVLKNVNYGKTSSQTKIFGEKGNKAK